MYHNVLNNYICVPRVVIFFSGVFKKKKEEEEICSLLESKQFLERSLELRKCFSFTLIMGQLNFSCNNKGQALWRMN